MSTITHLHPPPAAPADDPFRLGWRYVEETGPEGATDDFAHKMREYFRVGIPLYVIIDVPWVNEPGAIDLYGYRAGRRQFESLSLSEDGKLWLEPLRLWLVADGLDVYLEDPKGHRLPEYKDLVRSAQEANIQAAAEKIRADAAERRVGELEAEIARQKKRRRGRKP